MNALLLLDSSGCIIRCEISLYLLDNNFFFVPEPSITAQKGKKILIACISYIIIHEIQLLERSSLIAQFSKLGDLGNLVRLMFTILYN